LSSQHEKFGLSDAAPFAEGCDLATADRVEHLKSQINRPEPTKITEQTEDSSNLKPFAPLSSLIPDAVSKPNG
jgi:hypothetical protein